MTFTRVEPSADSIAYLRCTKYIDTVIKARALKTALDLGLFEHLLVRRTTTLPTLAQVMKADLLGANLLVQMLAQAGVVQIRNEDILFSEEFLQCLPFFDLMQAKLSFAGVILSDFAEYFTDLVQDPVAFRERATLFRIFSYPKGVEPDAATYHATRLWVNLTSRLSLYEAPPLRSVLEFSGSERLLDIGGNSGAFGLKLCQLQAIDQATIFDLPLICELGLNYVFDQDCADRISFFPGDLQSSDLPKGFSLHLFKSVLHDWSDADVRCFLQASVSCLEPGGRLIIYERIQAPLAGSSAFDSSPIWNFADLPVLLFYRSYRDPMLYKRCLEDLGMIIAKSCLLRLDSDFCVIEAIKPL